MVHTTDSRRRNNGSEVHRASKMRMSNALLLSSALSRRRIQRAACMWINDSRNNAFVYVDESLRRRNFLASLLVTRTYANCHERNTHTVKWLFRR